MLRGPRLYLGPLLPKDQEALMSWADDPELAAYNEVYRPANWAMQQARWATQEASRIEFALRLASDVPLIGFVQLTHIDVLHQSAQVGVCIGDQRFHRQGYASEALRLLEDYARTHLRLTRLSLQVLARHQAARDLYRQLGFVEEGLLRHALFLAGRWQDVVIMAKIHPSREIDLLSC